MTVHQVPRIRTALEMFLKRIPAIRRGRGDGTLVDAGVDHFVRYYVGSLFCSVLRGNEVETETIG